MTIEEQIKRHAERVTAAVSHRYAITCPRCGQKDRFHRHEIRRRNFYVSENNQSVAVRSWLVRWRCGDCDLRFTDYPPFALPYKRFVKAVVWQTAAEFFQEPTSSYRRACRGKSSASTLWRWMPWLDKLWASGCQAVRFLLAQNANSLIHRRDCLVSPAKFRSAARGSTLMGAWQTLTRIAAYEQHVPSPSLQQHGAGR